MRRQLAAVWGSARSPYRVHMDAVAYDNPAGRLHTLLERLCEVEPGRPFIEAWKIVLGASDDEVVPTLLAEVRALVGEIQVAVERQSVGQGHTAQVTQTRHQWENAIFPRDGPLGSPVENFWPKKELLVVLQATAEYLHSVASECRPLEDGELEELRGQVEELIEEMKASEEIPAAVKQVIVARLRDVIRALDHVGIGGANAVKLATEAVAGAIDLHDSPWWQSGMGRRVALVLSTVWFAFSAPATVQTALPVWEHAFAELASGQAQVGGPHQPGPAPSPPSPPVVLPSSTDGDPR